ncbi:sensor histidine kinase [Alishewanella sp. HL-SH05]|uniref:sensor histidine kinase n=1 Tax=Alishewanella sp. HL-SH05 TaxID=3461145 RepID=UPI0040410E6F
MTVKARATSMKAALIWLVMLICSITLALTLFLTNYLDYLRQNTQQQNQFSSLLNIIAVNAQSNLHHNKPELEEQRLKALDSIPMIKYVHIYQWDDSENKLNFFASFNKADSAALPSQQHRVEHLTTLAVNDDLMEQSKAILLNDKLLGYVYLRASRQELLSSQRQQTLINLLIAAMALILCFFLAFKLLKYFTKPINTLLALVHQVARSKDYSVRAPTTELTEFNQLNRAFNTMMDRIENELHKREHAEQEIKQLNQNLEQTVTERTLALKTSNQELLNTLATLHKYQTQIVETEKMASLGQMVAGIAHEVNTPIGLGVTASTLMQDRIQDIERAFADKKLTANQLQRFLADSKENLGIIYRNLERAAGLISSFKQVAVDQSNENQRRFNLKQLINEVLLSLRPHLKKTPHQLTVQCPDDLFIISKPGPINQILINLIMNSLIHAYEPNSQGHILISAEQRQNRCYLCYKDDGKGVPEHIRKRIFDPFVTTKRGEGGSGLGMHLVYNLVTQALNGNIYLDSQLGNGVTIDIDFPTSAQPLKK